jgi:hypothetical protein
MREVERVDGVLCIDAREPETAEDGAAVAGLQFQIDERFQGFHDAEIPGSS